jgi:HTH-type transcriptional regulator, transcriptional repressor of NAD biosynthesis genes
MKRGLVIGKFLPIHTGHIALINFAASQCDELIVSMSHSSTDPIDPNLRFEWIKEIFKDNTRIKPNRLVDDFDNYSADLETRTKVWAEVIRKVYPPIHVVFSSEEYGEPFAKHLGAEHRLFDKERIKFPVAASLICKHPFRYWDFIPEVVRPLFVKKICFYGPESTGKSTMAVQMAKKYKTESVPEVAREMITKNVFDAADIIAIGEAQTQRVIEKTKTANKLLFCDTDLITTKIYSQVYLNVIPPILTELEQQITYDLYFLMDIDVPWIADGLRDLGDRREEMFVIFKKELDDRNISYILIQGTPREREQRITQEIDKLLSSLS